MESLSPFLLTSTPLLHHPHKLLPTRLSALKSPKGFGSPSPKPKFKPKPQNPKDANPNPDDSYDPDVTIPEVVTNRMIRRMGVSVGAPLAVGLAFFPFFYYLKVVAKLDVPSWVPVLVSFVFFGTALAGVSYGIVSASWDPVREGSMLGWNEARRNWPVFWDSLWGSAASDGRSNRR